MAPGSLDNLGTLQRSVLATAMVAPGEAKQLGDLKTPSP
jgi:hypothetical protein